MQLDLTKSPVGNGQAKDNTTTVFTSVIEAMLACSNNDYTAQMAKLQLACADR